MAYGLSNTVKERIWTGEYNAADIAELETRYRRGELSGSSFSSAAYSYAGRLKSSGDEKGYRKYLDKAVEASDAFALTRKESITIAELDVRQSILREVGRYEEARTAIEAGLRKYSEEGSTPIHSKALLLVGKADVLENTGAAADEVRAVINEIEALAKEVEKDDEYQAIRVYRALLKHNKKVGDTLRAEAALANARRLIAETGAWDQERKLEYDLRA